MRWNSRQEMGKKCATRQNLRREIGVNGKQDKTSNVIFQRKTRKTGEKTGKTEERTLKKKQRKKTENYKKYRNKILTRFQEMLKTETRFQ